MGIEDIAEKYGKAAVIPGMRPVYVNSHRAKKMDDSNPSGNEREALKVIVELVNEG